MEKIVFEKCLIELNGAKKRVKSLTILLILIDTLTRISCSEWLSLVLTVLLQVAPVIDWLAFHIKVPDDGYDQQQSEYSQKYPQPGQICAATII